MSSDISFGIPTKYELFSDDSLKILYLAKEIEIKNKDIDFNTGYINPLLVIHSTKNQTLNLNLKVSEINNAFKVLKLSLIDC